MGYDYSLQFLAKHHDTVRKLIQIAQTGEVLTYESDRWEVLRQRHQLVRSLLANMERNMPEFKDIRRAIRTWTEPTGTGFRLNIGKPEHRVSGRPPAPAKLDWAEKYVPAAMASNVYRHDRTIGDQAELERFTGKIAEAMPAIEQVEVKFELAYDGDAIDAEWLDGVVNPIGWTVTAVDGPHATLKRKNAQT